MTRSRSRGRLVPFKSPKQRRYLYAKKPRIAAKFARHTKRRKRKR